MIEVSRAQAPAALEEFGAAVGLAATVHVDDDTDATAIVGVRQS
ncbi:MAG: hypothetical protein R2719_12540 [Micropruina sp.]